MRLRQRSAHAILMALVLVVEPLTANAADPRADVRRAHNLYNQGDFAGAIQAFAEIYRATGETKYLWDLAVAELDGARPFDAWVHLHEYEAKADALPVNVARAHKLEEDLTSKVGHIVVHAPSGASVIVDGALVGTAPLADPVVVNPDKPHTVLARSGENEIPSGGDADGTIHCPALARLAGASAVVPAPRDNPRSPTRTGAQVPPSASSHGPHHWARRCGRAGLRDGRFFRG